MELCAPHGSTSVGSCTRCGVFLCEKCRRWMSEKAFCTACLQRLGDKPSREAVWALGLATLGLVLWLPCFIALPLAYRELKRIKEGRSPEAGQAFASMARGLAWFELGAGGIAFVVLAVRAFG